MSAPSPAVPSPGPTPGLPFVLVAGLRPRVVASIAIIFGGTILLLLYLGFVAPHWPWYSNLAAVVTIFLGGFASLAAMWAAWGMRLLRGPFAPPFSRGPREP